MTDMELLRRYSAANDQDAFAELVRRHVDWVYSACRRQVRDATLAQDVTQVVFLTLARKARTISSGTSISGWLFTTSRFAAASALRMERRRRAHEREAAAMRADSQDAQDESHWLQIEPVLDEALGRLPASDRDAIILRYFRGMSHHDVAEMLGISEQAAQKRVTRALERLRVRLRPATGVAPAAMAALLTAHATKAAPPALAKAGAIAPGASAAAHIETLIKGVVIMQKISSVKVIAAAVVAAVLLLGGGSYVAVNYFHAAGAKPPEVPFVMSDLRDVRAMQAEGSNDDGVPTTMIADRARGAVLHLTYPFGTQVDVISPDGQIWMYRQGRPLVMHLPRKGPTLNVLIPEMDEQFKSIANSSPLRDPSEDAAIDGFRCDAFELQAGELAGGVVWMDQQTHRIREFRREKTDFKFTYNVPLAADAFALPVGAAQATDQEDYLAQHYPLDGSLAQFGGAGHVFALHEIHRDAAGRFLVVCSSRIDPALVKSVKDAPAGADLGRVVLDPSMKIVELARIKQRDFEVSYLAIGPLQPEKDGVLRLGVTMFEGEALLNATDLSPARATLVVEGKPTASVPLELRAFAMQAYDAVEPVVGLMAQTNMTFSRPLGSAIPGREEYVKALEERVGQELSADKGP